MKKKIVDTKNARKGEYRHIIKTIAAIGECPFCPHNFKYHKNPILKTSGEWFITRNSWPYKNAGHHYVIIDRIHKEELHEITSEDLMHIYILGTWAVQEFELKGGALAMRFGETTYTGASVCHIHAHLIVPKTEKGKALTVEFPIG